MKPIYLIVVLAAATALLAQQSVSPSGQSRTRQTSRNTIEQAPAEKAEPATLKRLAGKVQASTPLTHANLDVYLIEGDDLADTTQVLTLDEAMSLKKKGVMVKETGQVNELTVQNRGDDKEVFIMAGDIVKGGQQDRTLASDLPLKPKSGEVPVGSFCVEQGRWRKRGGESVSDFGSSKNVIASKEGKIAVRKAANQGEVWKSVAETQEKISRNIGKDVKPAASASSLQLTLEDKDLKTKIGAFKDSLLGAVEKSPRSLGVVFVINGEVNSAEIFAGHDLFRRVWPKLLEGIAAEAISLADAKKAEKPAASEEVMKFISKAEESPATKKPLQGSLKHVSAESDETCLFETADDKNDGKWLRRSIIKK
ncbi:ARPP-1 family domain-containing protein [Brevifollis gellanilyticus]|uniref:ARG and Rhodanese-Phosphatase-superfamily-associated domain-containing protein n=1 Tax=Brevifollis gellanilyticus TaxID=748831 RepID=A0A512MF95_9BACT|nr:DUF6569 family protein [Brevifollis gellanilyticus]GEP45417.1 hypothetical protein BGE01nite_47080 [Brevifollis gellanilyticus]